MVMADDCRCDWAGQGVRGLAVVTVAADDNGFGGALKSPDMCRPGSNRPFQLGEGQIRELNPTTFLGIRK